MSNDYDTSAPRVSSSEPKLGEADGATNLEFSRPFNVWRTSDYPEWVETIHSIQDQVSRDYLTGQGLGREREEEREGAGVPQRALQEQIASNPVTMWVSGLPSKTKFALKNLRKLVRLVVLDAMVAHERSPDLWIGYSRRPANYLGLKSRYNRLHISAMLIDVVDYLESVGLLTHWKAPKGRGGLQSRFKASPQLVYRFTSLAPSHKAITHDYSLMETIILKGEKPEAHYTTGKKIQTPAPLLDYDDDRHDGPAQWRENLRLINRQIASSELGLDIPSEVRGQLKNEVTIDYGRVHLYRVFNNGDWNLGGRFYGGWWQGQKGHDEHDKKTKKQTGWNIRRFITIDGQPTVEIDYSQIHPLMLYAQTGMYFEERHGVVVSKAGKGHPIPADCYAVGSDRDMAKLAFQVLLNTRTHRGLPNALNRRADEKGYDRDEFRACANALRELHKPIEEAFCTGMGLLLQRQDSNLAEAVMLNMAKRHITVLPIHDSFIVQSEYEGLLLSLMHSLLHEHIPELAGMNPAKLFKVVAADGSSRKL